MPMSAGNTCLALAVLYQHSSSTSRPCSPTSRPPPCSTRPTATRPASGLNGTMPLNSPFTSYKATFEAPAGLEPVVADLLGLGKGVAWINGNNLGVVRGGRQRPIEVGDKVALACSHYRTISRASAARTRAGASPRRRWWRSRHTVYFRVRLRVRLRPAHRADRLPRPSLPRTPSSARPQLSPSAPPDRCTTSHQTIGAPTQERSGRRRSLGSRALQSKAEHTYWRKVGSGERETREKVPTPSATGETWQGYHTRPINYSTKKIR
ncbi:hypothetical protein QYE76_061336 [Lolium multiflorum]|uniref:Beta-galactosidase galactose-binding domain-containing protein n=1 Tax=Lolium multiflorum TaxID=4521 RepID=A0AAD8W4L1_LOLMU|nr:hypothetical protein QYE76_061336 [Lolium multiflorum]